MASLKPPPARIVLSTGVCSTSGKDDVSFIFLKIFLGWDEAFPFGKKVGDPTFNHSD